MDHERLLLWPAFGVKARSDRHAFWWVRQADDDEWIEDTSGNDPQNDHLCQHLEHGHVAWPDGRPLC